MDSEAPGPGEKESPRGVGSFFAELPGLLLAALAVAVLIKTFVIQPFYIPSGSMIPTLEVNDRVMASKLHYRFVDISPGDIVVFENPYGEEIAESVPEAVVRSVLEALGIRTSGADDLIKRVIAVEGQEVAIRDNQVIVDGDPLSESYVALGSEMADRQPVTIPEGHVWVMGDNRGSSSDSRVFGPIPMDDVIGKALFRIWPPDRIGSLAVDSVTASR